MGIGFSLYLITDRHIVPVSSGDSPRPDIIAAVEEALKGGIEAVQLREKDMATRPLLELAYAMRELTSRYKAKLFINDRVDIALAVGADGVHLGQKSMPAGAVRRTWPELLIGVSCHNQAEAQIAEGERADFITLGPVYETPSKLKYGLSPIGVEAIRGIKAKVGIPVFAIGGIKLDNLSEVLSSGADGVAVISGILSAGDVKTKTEEYVRGLGPRRERALK